MFNAVRNRGISWAMHNLCFSREIPYEYAALKGRPAVLRKKCGAVTTGDWIRVLGIYLGFK